MGRPRRGRAGAGVAPQPEWPGWGAARQEEHATFQR